MTAGLYHDIPSAIHTIARTTSKTRDYLHQFRPIDSYRIYFMLDMWDNISSSVSLPNKISIFARSCIFLLSHQLHLQNIFQLPICSYPTSSSLQMTRKFCSTYIRYFPGIDSTMISSFYIRIGFMLA